MTNSTTRAIVAAVFVMLLNGVATALINPNFTPIHLVEQSAAIAVLDVPETVDGEQLSLNVAGLLKGATALSDIPLVVVTAWPEDTAAKMARAYGCDGYISKPIHAREFAEQVARYFKPESPA